MTGLKGWKKLVILIVSVLLIGGLVFCITVPQLPKKRGIILIPGLMGSGLYDEETGLPLWDPFLTEYSLFDILNPDTMISSIFGLVSNGRTTEVLDGILTQSEESVIRRLTLTEDGKNSDSRIRPVPEDYPYNQRYGVLSAYEGMYQAMYEKYNRQIGTEVVFFSYDWRLDNRESADLLEEFIREKGYKEVVLVAHSMGNLVAASYLAKSEENRNKVLGHVSYAAPYFGSLMALSVLENPYGMLESGLGAVRSMGGFIEGMLSNTLKKVESIYEEDFIPMIFNLPSMTQLLPTIELLDSLQYLYGESFLTVDGRPVTTQAELMEFYKSRAWSTKADGTLRKFVAEYESYLDSFYLEREGERVHVSTLVDTYYFAGINCNTEKSVSIADDTLQSSKFSLDGDGTVLVPSAILNNALNAQNVMLVDGASHFDCGMKVEGEMREVSYGFINKLLKKSRYLF